MEEVVTISVGELQRLIKSEVQKEIENIKPVRDNRMKDLEMYFRNQIDKRGIEISWYYAWNAIRSSAALRMGFKSMSKVTEPNYDEYLNKLKAEIDDILNVFSEKEKLL